MSRNYIVLKKRLNRYTFEGVWSQHLPDRRLLRRRLRPAAHRSGTAQTAHHRAGHPGVPRGGGGICLLFPRHIAKRTGQIDQDVAGSIPAERASKIRCHAVADVEGKCQKSKRHSYRGTYQKAQTKGVLNMKLLREFFFGFIVFSLIVGISACQKQEEKVEKAQTVADKPLSSFNAAISVENFPPEIEASSTFKAKVTVKNISTSLWQAKGQPDGTYAIHLAYHWVDIDGNVVVSDGVRTALPYDVVPGEEVVLDATIHAPDKDGDYIIEFDMVQEGVAWFKDKGSNTARVHTKVN